MASHKTHEALPLAAKSRIVTITGFSFPNKYTRNVPEATILRAQEVTTLPHTKWFYEVIYVCQLRTGLEVNAWPRGSVVG
jgi:hypothetical protein